MTTLRWSLGSRWFRWDPHLHTPGTLRNNQFGNDWDGYIKRIEEAQPPPIALGIADYFTLRGYKEVLLRRQAGALQSVAMIFPNVELRLTIETKDRQGINLHLLICPDDTDHITRVEEKLAQLRFRYRDDWFPCTDDSLRRLGRMHRNETLLSDEIALQEGANQFKVELNEIRELFDKDAWVQKNVLVVVAAGNDGLAGLARDASFHAQREELGRFAQIVFSGQPADRAYWLGEHPDFATNGQAQKPCLHGSDAHTMERILEPDQNRRCWIRAESTFDGLRQTLIEPDRRVHIGETPPPGPHTGNFIRAMQVRNTTWIENEEILLNEGLVTIIGAKGSGKTALADLLSFAAGADESDPGPASFIAKAGSLLDGLEGILEWGDGTRQSSTIPREPDAKESRVRYLSQQFVERLCASGDLAEPLLDEIERVIFNVIPEEDRLECSKFSELRNIILENPIAEREAERQAIRARTKLVAEESRNQRLIPTLRAKFQEAERDRKSIEKELAAIPLKVSSEKVKAHQAAAAKLQTLKAAIAKEERRAQDLRDVKAEVQRQVLSAATASMELRAKYSLLLDAATWDFLKLRVEDTALLKLAELEQAARDCAIAIRERGLSAVKMEENKSGDVLDAAGLAALTAETERLMKDLGLDQVNINRRVELEKRLVTAKASEEKARKEYDNAEKAPTRLKEAQADRLVRYEAVFNSLIAEEQALRKLYAPLNSRIENDTRLSKLKFVIHRMVDIDSWADRGESLLDLRKPPFNRRGVLADTARTSLLSAWKNGTPQEVRAAMKSFLEEHARSALDSLAKGSTHADFGEWLFSTDHISIRYSIQYEGVEIARLSPGTRGVVLLTLYLVLDEWDLRPLIIDQPEENLDPQSVYTALVPFFRDAAKRRQIIMVTHNANLVVNTDSDQVIVAESQRISPTELPKIRYIAGGLENPEIRSQVCRLLEGGEEAFRKRGQRYGVAR